MPRRSEVTDAQTVALFLGILRRLAQRGRAQLRALLVENDRLELLPEIRALFEALKNEPRAWSRRRSAASS